MQYKVVQVLAPGEGGEGQEIGRGSTKEEAMEVGRARSNWFRVYRFVVEEKLEKERDLIWDEDKGEYVKNVE